jgi:hypothetical protein
LWPEKFDSEALARIKANTTAQDWAALYQQEPTQEVGSYFKEDWLIPVLDLPPRSVLNVYGASDYAVTSDGGDYTVHVVIGIDPKRRMFLLDLWRQQASSNVWIEAYCDLVQKWSLSSGPRKSRKSRAALVLSSRHGRESGRPIQNASNFRRATTKQSGHRAFVTAWSWTACTCPPARHGYRT